MHTSEKADVRVECRACGAEIEGGQPFCISCGKVQPPRESDYFDVFGLSRKLTLNTSELEKQFYRYSRKLHPDVYAQSSNEEQQWSLVQASRLNDAYRTLKDPVERTKYLLKLEGVQLEDEQPSERAANPSKVPADLLEEVFELNMQLEELRANQKMGEEDPQLLGDLNRSKSQFEGQLNSLDGDIRALWTAWDAAWEREDDGKKAVAKASMTALLQRRSYLRNLVRDVTETLGEH